MNNGTIPKQKIALIGATGKTGTQFLTRALEAGHTVRALVRDPMKLQIAHPNLKVVKGDVLSLPTVKEVVKDTDIVVSVFGHVKGSPALLQKDGTKHILLAMNEFAVERIISLSGGGLPYPEKDQPKLIDRIIRGIMRITVPQILQDAEYHLAVLKASDRVWTVVRGPRLTDGPYTGQYQVGWVGTVQGTKLSRADLADYLLKQVNHIDFPSELPFLASS
ncbi:MAG: NAD(P)H-binding protein [Bacteroidota bacterium]